MARTAANLKKVAAAAKKAGGADKAKGAGAVKRTRTLTKAEQANRKLRESGWYMHPKLHRYVHGTKAGRARMKKAHMARKGKPLSAEHKRKIREGVRHNYRTGKTVNGLPSMLGKKGKKGKIKTTSDATRKRLLSKMREENKAARAAAREAAKKASAKKAPAKKASGKKAPAKATTRRSRAGGLPAKL